MQGFTIALDPHLFVLGKGSRIRPSTLRNNIVRVPVVGNSGYHMAMRRCLLDRHQAVLCQTYAPKLGDMFPCGLSPPKAIVILAFVEFSAAADGNLPPMLLTLKIPVAV